MVSPLSLKGVSAADLTSASLSVSDSRPSNTPTTYTFDASSFTTGTTLNCITIEFDTQADMLASPPSGLDTTSFTLNSSSLVTAGSWTVDNSVNGLLTITNAGGQTPAASGNLVYGGITNGDTANVTYFAQLNTYGNIDCSTGGAIDTVTVAITYVDGEQVELTIDPTLTFTCNGVASGQSVNGATTTLTTTCSGIDFGTNVSTSTNGVSAHDLEVSTNASSGYAIYIRHSGSLTNGAVNIANHTGTNLAPTAFPAAGTEAWGYTTEDATLGGGTANRFTNAGGFAGFNTSNEVVVDFASAAPSSQTTRVGQQVGISNTTDSGTYQTTIIYTLVATF